MNTFESALESGECVLFNKIILGTILYTIKDISVKTLKKVGLGNGQCLKK